MSQEHSLIKSAYLDPYTHLMNGNINAFIFRVREPGINRYTRNTQCWVTHLHVQSDNSFLDTLLSEPINNMLCGNGINWISNSITLISSDEEYGANRAKGVIDLIGIPDVRNALSDVFWNTHV